MLLFHNLTILIKKNMKEGAKLKNFKCEMTGNKDFNLSDYKGQNIIIYFYPRDNTPGCTSEGEDFRDNYKKFKKKNTQIFGVSKDTIKFRMLVQTLLLSLLCYKL